MAAARGILGLLSLILVAGGLLLSLFILLAGAINGAPVNKWYFLEADTSTISGAPSLSRWTFWNICDGSNGVDNCSGTLGRIVPARPFDPPSTRNFGTTTGVPAAFVGTRYYFYMTRFMFAFALISLFWGACALFTGVLALCTRLGAYLSGVLTTLAFVFQALTAALMTTAYVKARNIFRANGQTANIGKYAFGFEWAAFACFFLATVLFCVGGAASKRRDGPPKSGKGGFFAGKRSTSTCSRGSFITGDTRGGLVNGNNINGDRSSYIHGNTTTGDRSSYIHVNNTAGDRSSFIHGNNTNGDNLAGTTVHDSLAGTMNHDNRGGLVYDIVTRDNPHGEKEYV